MGKWPPCLDGFVSTMDGYPALPCLAVQKEEGEKRLDVEKENTKTSLSRLKNKLSLSRAAASSKQGLGTLAMAIPQGCWIT